MTWFPMGPDFVYAPRDRLGLLRLSRRNEYARQTRVDAIAVDPSNPDIFYTVDFVDIYADRGGGAVHTNGSAFRSDDGGRSWTSITDSLQQADPTVLPTCIAIHPLNTSHHYLGTASGAVYVSSNSGQTWDPPQSPASGKVVQIVVDPRNAANPATTVVYAGTADGLFISSTGGASWGLKAVLPGSVWSMAFSMPAMGTADFYVAIGAQGLYHATDPTKKWTMISGLPGRWLVNSGTEGAASRGAGGRPALVICWLEVLPCPRPASPRRRPPRRLMRSVPDSTPSSVARRSASPSATI